MKKKCRVCGSLNRSSHHRMSCLKGTKFVQIVKKSCAAHLRLPARFARNVGEFLENGALLYGQGVDVWRVQVIQRNGGCTFGKGWKKFYEGYKVCKDSVMLFKYLGYSGFKVEVFHGRTGLVVAEDRLGSSIAAGSDASGEDKAEKKKMGRPPFVYMESEEVGHVELYGMKLRKFTMYNLRGELRRRGLPLTSCKGELIERLGRFIMRYGQSYQLRRDKIEPEWPW